MRNHLSVVLSALLVGGASAPALAWDSFLVNPEGPSTPLSLNIAFPTKAQTTISASGELNLGLINSNASPTDLRIFKLSPAGALIGSPTLLSEAVIPGGTPVRREQRLAGLRLWQSYVAGDSTVAHPIISVTRASPVSLTNNGLQHVRSAPLPGGGVIILRSNNDDSNGAQRQTLLQRYSDYGQLQWSLPLSQHPAGDPENGAALHVSSSGQVHVSFIAAASGAVGDPARDFVLFAGEYSSGGLQLNSRVHDIADGSAARLWADAAHDTTIYLSYGVESAGGSQCYLTRVPAASQSITHLVSTPPGACVPAHRVAANASGSAAAINVTGAGTVLFRHDAAGALMYSAGVGGSVLNPAVAITLLSGGEVVTAYPLPGGSGRELFITAFDSSGVSIQPNLPNARPAFSGAGIPGYELQATPDGGYLAIYDAIDTQSSVLGVQVSKRFLN